MWLLERLALSARPIAAVVAAFAGLLIASSLVEAQWTGGSAGGGSFSGGGGSGSDWRGGGGAGGGGGGDVGSFLHLLLVLFRIHPALGMAGLLAVLLFLLWRGGNNRSFGHVDADSVGSAVPSPTNRAWFHVDITEVRVALDARARVFLQRELMNQGRRADTRTRTGLVALLQVVVRALRASESAWVYAGAKNFHPMSSILAEATFRRLAGEARAKFTHELVRNDATGVREGEGHGVVRSAEREGEGVVLVTLIVAASREIVDFEATSVAEVRKVLDDLGRLGPGELVALEVSWMPADENERMSTATLEALHPDMKLLPGAVGGRRFCAYCGGPFAAELPRCPHCGAPTHEARAPNGPS